MGYDDGKYYHPDRPASFYWEFEPFPISAVPLDEATTLCACGAEHYWTLREVRFRCGCLRRYQKMYLTQEIP